jgi:hypothetical protein
VDYGRRHVHVSNFFLENKKISKEEIPGIFLSNHRFCVSCLASPCGRHGRRLICREVDISIAMHIVDATLGSRSKIVPSVPFSSVRFLVTKANWEPDPPLSLDMCYHGPILVYRHMYDDLTMTMNSLVTRPSQTARRVYSSSSITITGCTWMVLCVAIGNFIVQTICLMGDMYMHNPVCWSVVCPVFNPVQRCRAAVEPVFWTCGCVGARISGFTYAFVVCDFTLDTNTPNNTGKKGYHRLLTIDSSLVRKVVMKIEVNKCTFVVIVSRQITWNLDNKD